MPNEDAYNSFAAGPSRIVIDINNQQSSSRESPPGNGQAQTSDNGSSGKRHITRACDACRRRKTKCDGPGMPDNICSNCLQGHKQCTYVEASKPRGPPKAYVTGLEDRLERLETLLKKASILRPNVDFSDELGPPVIRDSWKASDVGVEHRMPPKRDDSPSLPTIIPSLGSLNNPLVATEPKQIIIGVPSPSASGSSTPTPHSSARQQRKHIKAESDDNGAHPSGKLVPDIETLSSQESEDVSEFSVRLARLTLRGTEELKEDDANQLRYHGHSSQVTFAEAAKKFKQRRVQEAHSLGVTSPRPDPQSQPQSANFVVSSLPTRTPMQRSTYWRTPPWELTWEGVKNESTSFLSPFLANLPPPELADSLIDVYFLHINMQFPLLHRPTFERHWREGLCAKNVWFACLCFALFAVSSRWSNDPRVLPALTSAVAEDRVWHHAGILYFNTSMEITRLRRSLFNPGCLFEIQSIFLQANFLRGTPMYPTGWLFISIGIRKCQDLGAHRKSSYNDPPTIEEEQWRRVFWLMVAVDRLVSAALGRPAVVTEADFDLDLPLEVDDEYWEAGFKQPPDKPSTIAFFNCWAKLSRIVAYATKTIYAVNKSKVFIGPNTSRWPEEVLKQMNEALREFIESVPPHLRWSPHIEDATFSNQSASLYITYHLTEILIHRPFISPDPGTSTLFVEPPEHALETCTSAARACARILDAQIPKGFLSTPILINCAHICAATLLMKVWDIKSQAKHLSMGLRPEDHKEIEELMKDVEMFLKTMEALHPRWEIVDIFITMLRGSLPSLDSETFNVPPFRSVPFTKPYHIPLPPETSQRDNRPVDIPSSFENGWQWYTSASTPTFTGVKVDQYGSNVFADHIPPQYLGSTTPAQQYHYGTTTYPMDATYGPSQSYPIETLQYYSPAYSASLNSNTTQQIPVHQQTILPFHTIQRPDYYYQGHNGQ